MDFALERHRMVQVQLRGRGVADERLLAVMDELPRHLFVPERQRTKAYEDEPRPIGSGQTISQPYIVARMTELLGLTGSETVLEVGTGSGYQAAVLGRLAAEVWTIERHPELADRAASLLSIRAQIGPRVRLLWVSLQPIVPIGRQRTDDSRITQSQSSPISKGHSGTAQCGPGAIRQAITVQQGVG